MKQLDQIHLYLRNFLKPFKLIYTTNLTVYFQQK